METTIKKIYTPDELICAEAIHPGEMLKDELQARGISQRKFAAIIGMPYTFQRNHQWQTPYHDRHRTKNRSSHQYCCRFVVRFAGRLQYANCPTRQSAFCHA